LMQVAGMRWKIGYRDHKANSPGIGCWLKRVRLLRTCRRPTRRAWRWV
jgi:hypothetical protein